MLHIILNLLHIISPIPPIINLRLIINQFINLLLRSLSYRSHISTQHHRLTPNLLRLINQLSRFMSQSKHLRWRKKRSQTTDICLKLVKKFMITLSLPAT